MHLAELTPAIKSRQGRGQRLYQISKVNIGLGSRVRVRVRVKELRAFRTPHKPKIIFRTLPAEAVRGLVANSMRNAILLDMVYGPGSLEGSHAEVVVHDDEVPLKDVGLTWPDLNSHSEVEKVIMKLMHLGMGADQTLNYSGNDDNGDLNNPTASIFVRAKCKTTLLQMLALHFAASRIALLEL